MGVSPEYFLDQMSPFEAQALIEQYQKTYKESWEKVRLQCFYFAAPYADNLSLQDVLQFAWDTPIKKETMTPDELRKLKQEMADDIRGNF